MIPLYTTYRRRQQVLRRLWHVCGMEPPPSPWPQIGDWLAALSLAVLFALLWAL